MHVSIGVCAHDSVCARGRAARVCCCAGPGIQFVAPGRLPAGPARTMTMQWHINAEGVQTGVCVTGGRRQRHVEHARTRSPKLWQLKTEETNVRELCWRMLLLVWHTLARPRFMTRFARGRFCVSRVSEHVDVCAGDCCGDARVRLGKLAATCVTNRSGASWVL